ncbi:ABC transporter ATP-binding protein [Meiothermus taiwanensis]|uniref:Spermidine/putrescine import ATP-binding protein PotA n=2 Tax=Meiothermus taiwanensis TaxID=172827 RepID=A0A399DYT6_9DEIN|nr:ABC transporter ATP-binding protein [Meiothermus taiwanensis]AWR86040.1 ABC transporter related protein [Meiothermus taiwanensis WR-220]KZK14912.1 iron ABC transporter ATP-binding protein [Meiothermus taiwanensis]RIH75220.1 Spermidine/putrescine import ATP-binding protein PotA [Meiothermus taiwanensis]
MNTQHAERPTTPIQAHTPILRVQGLSKRFHPSLPPVVENVGFTVEQGEVFALLGPSGCGKTTTLRLIAGFEQPDSGQIWLEGREITRLPPEERGIGFVFQDYALFPHLSVFENVAFGLRRLRGKARQARVLEVLGLVGLTVFKDRKPGELSGGQQQRVALARAIAPGPKLVLLDEPFSSLDAALRQSTRDEVRALLKQAGIGAILVTHDQEEALSFADRLAVMRSGQLEQIGTPEEVYHHPRTPFVAQFLGRTNLIPGEARGLEAETPLGRLLLSEEAQGAVLLSLRPEGLGLAMPLGHLGIDGKQLEGTVLAREFKGHDMTYRVQLGNRELIVQESPESPFRPGDKVRVLVRARAVVVGRGR